MFRVTSHQALNCARLKCVDQKATLPLLGVYLTCQVVAVHNLVRFTRHFLYFIKSSKTLAYKGVVVTNGYSFKHSSRLFAPSNLLRYSSL